MELAKLMKYLENKYDPKLAAEWDRDKIGLHRVFAAGAGQEISTVMVTMDLNREALAFALQNKAQVVITRHPFLFLELDQERANPAKQEMVQQMLAHKIVPYAIHTNYDCSPNQGLRDLLERNFMVKKVERLEKRGNCFRCRLKNEITVNELKKKLRELFPSPVPLRTSRKADGSQKINEFYIASGAGGDEMITSHLHDCVYITGEAKWNEWVYALDNAVDLIEIGHYMEEYFVADVAALLKNAFKDICVLEFDVKNAFVEG